MSTPNTYDDFGDATSFIAYCADLLDESGFPVAAERMRKVGDEHRRLAALANTPSPHVRTLREDAAIAAMKGILEYRGYSLGDDRVAQLSNMAVAHADALTAALASVRGEP
jgi:hypothetical protein